MSDEKMLLHVAFPLDSDGFLRRECPTCGREFKWMHTPDDQETVQIAVADGGYYCPYCGVQAETNTWLTQAQVEFARSAVANQAMERVVESLRHTLDNIGRSSGGSIRTSHGSNNRSDEPDPLTEVDDMRLASFACHPTEPLKIADDWQRETHCLICGQTS